MADKSQEEIAREVHQAVLGVNGTDDRGLVGDLKELVKLFREQNGRVRRNTLKITAIIFLLVGTGIVGGLEIADVINLLGG